MRLVRACVALVACLLCAACTTTSDEFAIAYHEVSTSTQVGGVVHITPVAVGAAIGLMQNGAWHAAGGCECAEDSQTLHGTTLAQNPDSRTTLVLICDDTHIKIYVGLGLVFEQVQFTNRGAHVPAPSYTINGAATTGTIAYEGSNHWLIAYTDTNAAVQVRELNTASRTLSQPINMTPALVTNAAAGPAIAYFSGRVVP